MLDFLLGWRQVDHDTHADPTLVDSGELASDQLFAADEACLEQTLHLDVQAAKDSQTVLFDRQRLVSALVVFEPKDSNRVFP